MVAAMTAVSLTQQQLDEEARMATLQTDAEAEQEQSEWQKS